MPKLIDYNRAVHLWWIARQKLQLARLDRGGICEPEQARAKRLDTLCIRLDERRRGL